MIVIEGRGYIVEVRDVDNGDRGEKGKDKEAGEEGKG